MQALTSLDQLPPPAPGFTRVVRGEYAERPKRAVADHMDERWRFLPNPYNDGVAAPKWDYNCAAWEHTFNEWWPEHAREALRQAGLRFVALDVPNDRILRGRKQAMIDRDAAVLVAELH